MSGDCFVGCDVLIMMASGYCGSLLNRMRSLLPNASSNEISSGPVSLTEEIYPCSGLLHRVQSILSVHIPIYASMNQSDTRVPEVAGVVIHIISSSYFSDYR